MSACSSVICAFVLWVTFPILIKVLVHFLGWIINYEMQSPLFMHFSAENLHAKQDTKLSKSPQQLSPLCTDKAPKLFGCGYEGHISGIRAGIGISWMFSQHFARSSGSCSNILKLGPGQAVSWALHDQMADEIRTFRVNTSGSGSLAAKKCLLTHFF